MIGLKCHKSLSQINICALKNNIRSLLYDIIVYENLYHDDDDIFIVYNFNDLIN